MRQFFRFLRSDLFFSLAGGFALGLAGMAVIRPAAAGHGDDVAKALTVETPPQSIKLDSKAS